MRRKHISNTGMINWSNRQRADATAEEVIVIATTSLPVIDVSPLRRGEDASDAARQLDEACRDLGFFVVEGHGIDPALRKRMFGAAADFFAQPDEVKQQAAISESGAAHRGFAPLAGEVLEDGLAGDAKESFDLATDQPADHPEVLRGTPLHGMNLWPPVPGFRETCEEYFVASMDAAHLVLRLVARALGLPEDWFTSKMVDNITYLRFLHYPATDAEPGDPDQPGCGAHTDYGLVTLLAEDEVGGLQVKRRSGEWLDVRTEPGQLVVNLGDLLARWTNHRWVSTPHRVVRPPNRSRYSIPFFVNTAYHALVECLPTCVDPASPWPYEPIEVGDYLVSRFDDTHAYRQETAS